MRDADGLGARAARGAAWIAAARIAMRLLGVVSTIVLARLLAPADFGLVAVALAAMQLLQNLSDFGVARAVVRFQDAGRDDLDTLFTLSALRGLAVGLLLVVAAGPAADFYGDPRLEPAFLIIALYPLLTGFINPAFFEFERALDFSKEFVSSALNRLAGVAVSIAVALLFRSFLAIIVGLVVSGAVQLALSYLMRPARPRFTVVSARKVFGFSGWLAGASFLAALNNKLDAFVLARVVGASGTGAYYVGTQLADMPSNELATPVARAIYPGLAAMGGEAARMRAGFLKAVAVLGALALPASVGFAFVAEDVIGLLMGGKWGEAAPVVEILAPLMGFQALFAATSYYAIALGRARLVFLRELALFLIRFPALVFATLAYGLSGAVWAAAAGAAVGVLLDLVLYARLARAPFWEPLWSARRPILAVAVMSAWFLLLRPLAGAPAGAPARLAVDIIAGAGVYLAVLAALWRLEGKPAGAESAGMAALALLASRLRRKDARPPRLG